MMPQALLATRIRPRRVNIMWMLGMHPADQTYLPLLKITRKSKLRNSNGTVVGPQYKGSSISREALLKDESDDDPFAKHSEQDESGNSEYADPEGD